jgi:hypothetical protein
MQYTKNSLLSRVNIPSHKRRPKRRRWSSDLDPMLVGIIIRVCQGMVFTYLVVSSELLLKNNPSLDNSAAQWSLGQILALIDVIPDWSDYATRLSKRNKTLSERERCGRETRKGRQEKAVV